VADDSVPQWRKSPPRQEITARAASITATWQRQCGMMKTGRQKQFEKEILHQAPSFSTSEEKRKEEVKREGCEGTL